jgi:hypothetical protein
MKTLVLSLMLSIAAAPAPVILAQPAAAGGDKTGSTTGGFDG